MTDIAALQKELESAIAEAETLEGLEAVRIAGFREVEADKLFGRPLPELVHRLEIRLRPPAEVRADYVATVARLLAACG